MNRRKHPREPDPLTMVDTGAKFDGLAHRLLLWRVWDKSRPYAAFVMCNPSMANQHTNDPTVKRCMRFAHDWRYGGVYVMNLFSHVSTSPFELPFIAQPWTARNDFYIHEYANKAGIVIAAWGKVVSVNGKDEFVGNRQLTKDVRKQFMSVVAERVTAVTNMFDGNLYCLQHNKDGSPRHPLYIKGTTEPVVWLDRGKPVGAQPPWPVSPQQTEAFATNPR